MTSVLDVSLKRTTVKQLQLMVKFLECHKYLAGGKLRSKEQIALSDRLWSECASILNTEGDSRSPAEWKKYFNQYKSRLAAKMRRIKDVEDCKYSDNVEAPLTELEEKFAAVCGFQITSSAIPKLTLKINPLKQSNDSTGSISDKCSSYDSEQDISRDSESDKEDKPVPETNESERGITLQLKLQRKRRKSYEDNGEKGEKDSNIETFGQNLAVKMQTLPGNQRIIVEKIINDTLFFAEMGCLTVAHASYLTNNLHKS